MYDSEDERTDSSCNRQPDSLEWLILESQKENKQEQSPKIFLTLPSDVSDQPTTTTTIDVSDFVIEIIR